MPVPNLPFSMSDINAEFGTKSLVEHLVAEVGILPQSMSSLEGLSKLNFAVFPPDWTTQYNKNINSFYFASGTKSVNISPIDETVNVTLSGSRATAKHNGGVPENGPWTVSHGDTFQLRLQASSSYSSSVSGTLTIQETGDQLSWRVWTETDPDENL